MIDEADPPYVPQVGSKWSDNTQTVFVVDQYNPPYPGRKANVLFHKLDSKGVIVKRLSVVLSTMYELGIGGWTPDRLK